MITMNGIRNAFWCVVAFGIVACASWAGEVEQQTFPLSARASEAQNPQPENERLAAQLELQAAHTPRGIVLTLSDVSFDTGRADLKPGATRSLDQIVAFLNQHPERRVQVEGFTDSAGANDYNLELAQTRADLVAMAILHRGIDAERVRALGFGEAFPVASNTDAGSRQRNRRVEIIVSNDARAIPGRTAAGSP